LRGFEVGLAEDGIGSLWREEASYTKISGLLYWHRSRSVKMGLEGERWGTEREGDFLRP
jgi:hypothetical protein